MNGQTLLLCGLASLLPAVAVSAGAQTVPRPPLVVMILGANEEGARPFTESFLDGMRQAGQVQGRTVQIDVRFGDRDPARVRALIRESIAARPAVLVVAGLIAARHARDALEERPHGGAQPSGLAHGAVAQPASAMSKNLTLGHAAHPAPTRLY